MYARTRTATVLGYDDRCNLCTVIQSRGPVKRGAEGDILESRAARTYEDMKTCPHCFENCVI